MTVCVIRNKDSISIQDVCVRNIKAENRPISCTVEYAISFLKSIWKIKDTDASTAPISDSIIPTHVALLPIYGRNLYKPNTAILTKNPLKNIEKLVNAST